MNTTHNQQSANESRVSSLLVFDQTTLPLPDDAFPLKKKRKNRKRLWKRIFLTFFLLILIFLVTTAGLLYTYYQQQLPEVDQYAHQVIPQDTRIYDRNTVLLYDAYAQNLNNGGRRVSIKLEEVPKVMQDAIVATEDRTFWTNPGINVQSTLRAALSHDGGASTITQQVIKNLSHNSQHTFQRKFQEAVLAIGMTQKYTKAQILAMYFNVASFGAFDVGIESAVEAYFHLQSICTTSGTCSPGIERLEYNAQGKMDPILGLARASLLAAMPNSPGTIDPTLGPLAKQMALARQKIVLQAMISQKMSVDGQIITSLIAKQAENLTAHMDFPPYQHSKLAPHFVDWVINQLAFQLGNGDYSTGLNLFEQGGFTIRTTIDINLETYVEHAIDQHLNKPDYQYYPLALRGDQILSKTFNIHSGAAIVLDAKTGEILAMDGSANYFSTDPSVGGQYNMAAPPPGSPKYPSGRPPGATMLPITMAAFYKTLSLTNESMSVLQSGNFSDQITAANITSKKIIGSIGPAKLGSVAQDMGITPPQDTGINFAQGAENVSLLQMTNAYQVLANNGKRVQPVGVLAIYDHNGHEIYHYNPAQPPATSVIPAQITHLITFNMMNVTNRKKTFGDDYQLSFADQNATCARITLCNYQVAAQSSDTNGTEDGNTTIGYTPDVVVGTWVGNIDGKRMNNTVVGSTGAVAIWHSIIERALGWCGTQATTSSYFRSDKVPCGPAPHLSFSNNPTRTFFPY